MRLSACRNEGYNDEIRHLACKTLAHLNMRIKDLSYPATFGPNSVESGDSSSAALVCFLLFPRLRAQGQLPYAGGGPTQRNRVILLSAEHPLGHYPDHGSMAMVPSYGRTIRQDAAFGIASERRFTSGQSDMALAVGGRYCRDVRCRVLS